MAKDYAGRIGNEGAQFVKASAQRAPKKGGGKVTAGSDLRCGRERKRGGK